METDQFIEWLSKELEQRGWSQGELCRQSGLSSASVSNVLNGQQTPGLRFYQGVATAFGIPLDDVLRAAGLLPPEPESDQVLGEINYYLSEMPAEEQRRFLIMARSIWEHYQSDEATEGPSPLPEIVSGEASGVVRLDPLEMSLVQLLKKTSDTFKEAVISTVRAWLVYEGVKQSDEAVLE
jgi:transcriptional regulator with XRE-family HTH domain